MTQTAHLKRWVPWIVLAAVLALLAPFLDLHATLASFSDLSKYTIALTVALYLLNRLSMAHKWNVLLRARNCWLSQWAAFRIYLESGLVAYAIPVCVGSDVFRAARLSLTGSSASKVSATIVLERVLGLLATLTASCAALVLVVLGGRRELRALLAIVAAALFVGAVLTVLSMSAKLYHVLRRTLSRWTGNRIVGTLDTLHAEYVSLGTRARPLIVFFLLSILNQIIQTAMFVPVLVSLGVEVDPLALFALLPLSKVLIQVIPIPAGIGVAEGTQVAALSLAHVPAAQGLAVALVLRAIDVTMLLPAGVAYAADAWQLRKA